MLAGRTLLIPPHPPLGGLASLLAVAALITATSRIAAQEVWSQMISTALVENGVPIQLELVIYRPAGVWPLPVVVFNHGSTGTGSDPAEFVKTWHSPTVAAWFNQRGYMVVFPQRRGRGKSGGLYDEGFAPDRSGYSCEPFYSLPGVNRAMTDIDEVMKHLRLRPDVDTRRMLIAGQSRGGILSIAYAGTRPTVFRGAINFVGGWMSDSCPNPTAINTTTFARGAPFPNQTVWLYGQNDPYYSLQHSRYNFDYFSSLGGKGTFNTFYLGAGVVGHNVFLYPALWGPVVDQYLAGLPPVPPLNPSADHLVNLSVRAQSGTDPAIVGFYVAGNANRPVLLRGIGPALSQWDINAPAVAPHLTLFDSKAAILRTADAWGGDSVVRDTFAAVGAFGLDDATTDAAFVTSLAQGGYTLHLNDTQPGRIMLGEIYATTGAGLVNLSARVHAGPGEATAIVGFTIGGLQPRRVLIRAAGPAMLPLHVSDAVADPHLRVFNTAGASIGSNDDWGTQESGTAADMAAIFSQVGAFEYAPGSRDSAIVVELPPGGYTAHATAATEGSVLIEIYAVP